MMKPLACCLLMILCPVAGTAAPEAKTGEFHRTKPITKISFGSCNNPRNGESPMYEAILRHQPDVFVWLGDNIYGDTEDMELFKKKYDELEAQKGFQKLREATTMIATWDDHDYGVNDGGNTYKMRRESQQLLIDFFQDPADSPRRKREGVHASYTFGEGDKVCQILILDTRYFRDVLPRSKAKRRPNTVGWYEPTDDTSMTLLGDAQWKWLEEQLQVPASVRIIASSIQTLAVEKGMENWGNVPHEQQRLFELLKKHKVNHTLAISGDVHYAELTKKDIGGYAFYDLTSSGMTNTSRHWANAANSMRVGESHPVRNAGLIEIDWGKKSLELAIINEKAEKILTHPLKFSELEFK